MVRARIVLPAMLASFAGASAAEQPDLAPFRQAVAEFSDRLRSALATALKEGGPVGAIGVCKLVAPAIAQELSETGRISVRRTSLRTRNPDNAPDEWERQTLQEFLSRKEQGENPAQMEAWTISGEGEGRQLRYMKAIPTAEMCLQCHGTAISPEVKAALAESYPQDEATGFSAGDIRGAFSMTAPLPAGGAR